MTRRGRRASNAGCEPEDGERSGQGIEVLGVHGVLLGGRPESVVMVNLQVVELRVNIAERHQFASEGSRCSRRGLRNTRLISLRCSSGSGGWQATA